MPVTDNLDSAGRFRPERKEFFKAFADELALAGFEVLSAGTNEDWGNIKLATAEFTKYDVDSLMVADLLVVVTNERLNRDIYLELGIALGRQLPVIVVMAASTKLTFMGLGLEELGTIEVRRFDSDQEALPLMRSALEKIAILPPTASATSNDVALTAE